MKKLITKYWGLVLVVVLLSSLFVVGAPASAANYAWATTAAVPTAFTVLAPAGFTGIKAVAQSGNTIYAVGADATVNYLYKSTDAGATWIPQTTSIVANVVGTNDITLVAVAPDDPNIVVLVDTNNGGGTDIVYISTTGGTLFSQLTNAGQTSTINTVAISPMTTARYIAVGGLGVTTCATWTLNLVSPSWTDRATTIGFTKVLALAFSSNFAADNGLLAVTANGTTTTAVSVFSFNAGLGWNPVGYDFPRTIDGTSPIAQNTKATMALDNNFYLGDLSQQIGFVSLVSTNTTGGVYRFDPTALMTAVYTTQSVNSIAWDGTNLIAAPTDVAAGGALSILRSANAYSVVPALIPSSVLKTPGTGTNPIVIFSGANAFAFSQGQNSAIAKSTDLGKSFNGVALVVSNFNGIKDIWVSPDGALKYTAVFDGTDINVWRADGAVWQRIFILAAPAVAQQAWLVRADAGTPDTVFLGNKGSTLMYKSTDGGASWTIRGMAANIADFAVQDANTLYAVNSANSWVYKSTTGAFTWTAIPVAFLGGVGYSVNLIADNSLIVGTTTGVAYSNDGATFTTCFSALGDLTAGNMVTAATGTGTGDTIFVGSSGGMLAKWVIGTSANWGAAVGATLAQPIHGIAYANGILYAFNDTANATYRFITPTFSIAAAFISDTLTTTIQAAQATRVNELVLSTGSNVLWAVDALPAPDDILSYTDPFVGAAGIPTPTYPTNNAIIPVNSLSGNTNPFNFMWSVPSAVAPALGFGFNVQVYLDEAGTIPYAGDVFTTVSNFSYVTGVVSAAGLGTTAFVGTPGVTYYWRVRVDSATPELGPWSAMQSFNVQQLQAIVPVLSSPVNGSDIAVGQTAAFSWNPIAGATSYSFELSADSTFATTIYKTTANAAGIAVPSTVKLTAGTTYFWRVKVLTPAAGEWSTVANFTVKAPVVAPPAVTIPPAVTPIVTVSIPAATTTVITIPPATTTTTEVNPSYIWAIIIIGAVLVIAVIVLIVRTRRSV